MISQQQKLIANKYIFTVKTLELPEQSKMTSAEYKRHSRLKIQF